eukprot:UN14463
MISFLNSGFTRCSNNFFASFCILSCSSCKLSLLFITFDVVSLSLDELLRFSSAVAFLLLVSNDTKTKLVSSSPVFDLLSTDVISIFVLSICFSFGSLFTGTKASVSTELSLSIGHNLTIGCVYSIFLNTPQS